jgi:hypothetical protein
MKVLKGLIINGNYMKNPVNKMSERALATTALVFVGIIVLFVIILIIVVL